MTWQAVIRGVFGCSNIWQTELSICPEVYLVLLTFLAPTNTIQFVVLACFAFSNQVTLLKFTGVGFDLSVCSFVSFPQCVRLFRFISVFACFLSVLAPWGRGEVFY